MATESQQPAPSNYNDITFREIYAKVKELNRYLWSKWLIILCLGLLGGLLGFGIAYMQSPKYTATTTFVLEESGSGSPLAGLGGLASVVGIDMGGGGGGLFQGDNILELYKSRSMIEKTLFTSIPINGKQELLINRFIDFNNLRARWEKPELKNIKFDQQPIADDAAYSPGVRLKDSVINEIVKEIRLKNLIVTKIDKKLSIIKAEVTATDEVFAKAFNDHIVAVVNDFYVQTKTKKSMENVSILQKKVDSVRSVMNGAIYASAAVMDATPNLNPTRQAQRSAPMQRSQFSAETNKAILAELVKNLEISKITMLKDAPLIQIVDKPVFPLEKKKLGKSIGIILGGIIAGVLTVVFLLIRKIMKDILA